MILVLGAVAAFALGLAYVYVAHWWKEIHTTRFSFEDRDTYLFLGVRQWLGSRHADLVAMRALREALRLKLAGVGYQRVLVQVSALKLADRRAFWFLMGALSPALGHEKVKLALVCARRSPAESRFRESGLLVPFVSIREAERFLGSEEPPHRVLLEREQLDALLDRGHLKAA